MPKQHKRRHHKGKASRKPYQKAPSVQAPIYQCEASVVEGLEEIALDEVRRAFGKRVRIYQSGQAGVVRFSYRGELRHLLRLQSVLSVYLSFHFPIPRPRALLGDQNFRQLLSYIEEVRQLMPPESYRLLYLSAAGSDSSVMRRLIERLATELGIAVASHEGDLLLRLRRSRQKEGWELLIRLSPRPLATRAWRQCNMEGALNATIAHAMIRFTRPTQSDIVLNLACGSGTLLIERLAVGAAKRLIGCDISAEGLSCAQKNLVASGNAEQVELYAWDARSLPLADESVDVLCADLPFGHLVGSHAENVTLYPAIMQEAARVSRRGGIFVLITHEVRLMTSILKKSSAWQIKHTQMVTQGGLHPRIFVLKRK